MKTFKFTLVLSGIAEITSDLADALYEATGGDIELQMSDGVATLDCERRAKSLGEAIRGSIQQVEGAGLGVRVLRVESETANVIAKINAELLGAGVTE